MSSLEKAHLATPVPSKHEALLPEHAQEGPWEGNVRFQGVGWTGLTAQQSTYPAHGYQSFDALSDARAISMVPPGRKFDVK